MSLPVELQTLNITHYKGWKYPDWMAGKQSGGPKDLQKTLSLVLEPTWTWS